MDMRTHGKEFDLYLERAKDESGVRFVRCRVNGVETDGSAVICVSAMSTKMGVSSRNFTTWWCCLLACRRQSMCWNWRKTADIKLTADNFAATSDFAPVQTSREGIFTCGAIAGPKDIPQSVVEGSAAAAAVADLLAPARLSA